MIHKTAIINPKAKISSNVEIGPYSVIGPDVEIDSDVIIQSHVNITGHTKVSKKNIFYPMSSIGSNPQDLKYKGEKMFFEERVLLSQSKILTTIKL